MPDLMRTRTVSSQGERLYVLDAKNRPVEVFDRSEWSRWMAGNELIFRRTLLEESDLTVTTRFRGVAEKADLVERGDAIIAQAAVRPGPVLHIEDVTWMLAVQRRNQLAAVQFCVGERGHVEDDAEHFLCT